MRLLVALTRQSRLAHIVLAANTHSFMDWLQDGTDFTCSV